MRNTFLIFEVVFLVIAIGFLFAVSGGDNDVDDESFEAMNDDATSQTPDFDHGVDDETIITSPAITIHEDNDDEDTNEELDKGIEGNAVLDDEYENLWLFQYDPVEVGYEQDVEVEDGMVLKMKTLAINPPVFEIRNFLSPEECDHVMQLALVNGLHTSQTVPDRPVVEDEDELAKISDVFNDYDDDGDGRLDPGELREVVSLFPAAKNVELTDDHIKELIELKLDRDLDGKIDLDEFIDSDTPEMEAEIESWLVAIGEIGEKEAIRSRARVSDQAWLDQWTTDDEILLRLQDRVIGLTLLPSTIIQTSEHLQVVRYQPGGHYHAHYDSNDLDDDLECAHTYGIQDGDDTRKIKHSDDFSQKRLCRLATVLYYLNDVEEGGETAFPVADNETFTQETLEAVPYDIYDLSNHCYNSNVVVPPERGKAIMWYNHFLDDETGWLGHNRNHSLHGGCDVTKGTKWIANNWITVDDSAYRQILFHRRHFAESEVASLIKSTTEEVPSVVDNVQDSAETEEVPNGNVRESAEDHSDDEGYGTDVEVETFQPKEENREEEDDTGGRYYSDSLPDNQIDDSVSNMGGKRHGNFEEEDGNLLNQEEHYLFRKALRGSIDETNRHQKNLDEIRRGQKIHISDEL